MSLSNLMVFFHPLSRVEHAEGKRVEEKHVSLEDSAAVAGVHWQRARRSGSLTWPPMLPRRERRTWVVITGTGGQGSSTQSRGASYADQADPLRLSQWQPPTLRRVKGRDFFTSALGHSKCKASTQSTLQLLNNEQFLSTYAYTERGENDHIQSWCKSKQNCALDGHAGCRAPLGSPREQTRVT